MYRMEQGFLSRTYLLSGLDERTGKREAHFPFSRLKFRFPGMQTGAERQFPFSLSLFLNTPNRAKNLIKIGLLALFFCLPKCQNVGRRAFV